MRTDRNKTLREANYVDANEHRTGYGSHCSAGRYLGHTRNRGRAKAAVPKPQDKLALGENEVKQLLLLVDADKNGKISKEEWMKFMEAELDRLDKDKKGQLDANECGEVSAACLCGC